MPVRVSRTGASHDSVKRKTRTKEGKEFRFECPLICCRFIENSSNLKLHGWDDRFIFRETGSNERVETGDIGEGWSI